MQFKETEQISDSDSNIAEMLELPGCEFKATGINMVQVLVGKLYATING